MRGSACYDCVRGVGGDPVHEFEADASVCSGDDVDAHGKR